MSSNRVSRNAKKILLAMLKKGARTVKELRDALETERKMKKTGSFERKWPRENSCPRTLRNLISQGLVTRKQFLHYWGYCRFYEGRFIYFHNREGFTYGWATLNRPRDFGGIYGFLQFNCYAGMPVHIQK